MKKALGPDEKREPAGYLIDKQQLSIRRACAALNLSAAAYYYRFKPKDGDAVIVSCLDELAEKYPTYDVLKPGIYCQSTVM